MRRLQRYGLQALHGLGLLCIAMLLSLAGSLAATPGGMGGTGIEPGGIGGTGIHPGGIGGTGILAIGPVQRFGSIFVNGGEYELPHGVRYSVDGQPGTERSLHLGDMVRVQAVEHGGRLEAVDVSIDHALIGRLTQIDRANGQVRVLGQTVVLSPDTQVRNAEDQALPREALAVGDVVRVSALDQGDGRWQALRVVRLTTAHMANAQTPLLLRGRVDAVNVAAHQVRVHGKWFGVAPGAVPVWPAPGGDVVLRGVQGRSGDVITAIMTAPAVKAPVGTRVIMAGYLQSGPQGLEAHGLHVLGATPLLDAQLRAAALQAAPTLIDGVLRSATTVAVQRVIPQIDAMQYALPPLAATQPSHAPSMSSDRSQAAANAAGAVLTGPAVQMPSIVTPVPPMVSLPGVPSSVLPAIPQVPPTPQMPSISTPLPPPAMTPPQVPSVAPAVVTPPSVSLPNIPASPQLPSVPRP